jgi:hypothetical protein
MLLLYICVSVDGTFFVFELWVFVRTGTSTCTCCTETMPLRTRMSGSSVRNNATYLPTYCVVWLDFAGA